MVNSFSDRYEVLTDEGFQPFDGIKRLISKQIIELKFEDGLFLKCTEKHLIKYKDKFIEAGTLAVGDVLSNKKIIDIVIHENAEYVYDLLNVKNTNSYITNGIISHNCAFVENWDEFFASVFPTISSGETTKILFTSTPNGLNHYYKTCIGAKEGTNGYAYVEVPWQRVPGRDQNWYNETISAMDFDYEKFAQEFECVTEDATITVRDIVTDEIIDVPIGMFYRWLSMEMK
jgi:hypothetical protein